MSEFLQHTMSAIRHQMKALDEALDMLEKQLAQRPSEPVDDGSPRCGQCNSKKLERLQAMGLKASYLCKECNFVTE